MSAPVIQIAGNGHGNGRGNGRAVGRAMDIDVGMVERFSTRELERPLDWICFLAAMLGFTAVAISGEIGTPTLSFGYAFMLLSLVRSRIPIPAERAVTLFSIALFFGCAVWGLFVTGDLLPPIVFSTIYLQGLRLMVPRSRRDQLQILTIAFGMILLASVLTTSILFLPLCLLFGLTAFVGLILLTVKHEALALGDEPPPRVGAPTLVTRRFYRSVGIAAFALYLLASVFFLSLPRYQGADWFRFLRRSGGGDMSPEALSGDGDGMDLGEISEIRLDSRIVMRVSFPDFPNPTGSPPYDHLRLRGQVLNRFNGTGWRLEDFGGPHESRGLPISLIPFWEPDGNQERVVRQVIEQEPDSSPFFYGLQRPISLRLRSDRLRQLFVEERGGWARMAGVSRQPEAISYVVRSRVNLATEHLSLMEAYPEEYTEPLSIAVGDDPDQMAEEIGRRFFRMTRRARQLYGAERSTVPWAINAQPLFDLAVRWAAEAGASDPTDIAREFQRRLRSSEFTYSLTPDLNESDEFPINRFLTETKEGHCELFATSMALMLRTLGIPSRLVTGYYSREWNATGGYYVVRESHAHAWVESLDPKRGWLTWDPTPESGLPTTTTITFWGELAHWFDAHRHNWYRWVIDLGRQEQRELFASLGLPAGFWHSVVSDIANDVREARHRARQIGIWGPLLIGLAVFAVILGAYLSSKITARWDQRGLGRRIVRNGAPRYYRDLLRWLRQRGHVRPLGQTPAEFARSILEVHPTWEAVDRITALYYRDRYAPQALGAEDRRQAEALLATLMR